MSFDCEPRLPQNACADDIFVKVKNFSPVPCSQPPLPIPPSAMIKVPVKVALIDVTEPIMDSIFISGGFEDVKNIQRKLTLTQCHITDKFLFVEGYILKNIGYAVPIENEMHDCDKHCRVVKNHYKDLTAKLDFHFTIPVDIQGCSNKLNPPVDNGSYFVDCMKPCDQGSSGELHCEKYYRQHVHLNEGFKCELESYTISESVFLKKESCETDWRYDTILEKLELTLCMAVLQTQQIVIDTIPPVCPTGCYYQP